MYVAIQQRYHANSYLLQLLNIEMPVDNYSINNNQNSNWRRILENNSK